MPFCECIDNYMKAITTSCNNHFFYDMYLDYFQEKVESHSQLVPQSVHVDFDSLKLKILVKYASNKFPIRPLLIE